MSLQSTNYNASRQAKPRLSFSQIAASKLLERRAARNARSLNFRRYVEQASPRYQWYRHCEVIANVAERVASGELKRVMLFVPPRHSKSETISRLFSGYYLRKHPDQWVGLSSYSAELAYVLSRAAQENYIRSGGTVSSGASAVKHWETGHGGGFWAAGVGGPITGKGFHLGIIDDPLKNAEEAASEVIREKQKEWYRSTFYTRAEPNAAIIGIQTRWHEDDLSGWLLSEEVGEQPERWHIVNLPAIAEPGPTYPASCTVEPDWREEGEALCEERYSVERLRQIESRVGPYYWNALFQQRPTAKEGDFFKVSKIETVAEVPSNLTLCRGWDLAGTEGGGAFTAAVLLGKDANGVWYVVDVQRGQWSTDDVETQLVSIARTDGQRVKIHLPQDPGQAGKKQAISFGRLLAGFNAVIEPVTGSKETRAFSFSAQVNLGNVKVLQAGWTKAFLEELRQFPRGKFKDQVDAASDAFNELAGQKQFNQGTWFR